LDHQLKRGLLDVCVLAATANQDAYGYQIIRDVSHCVSISESTLYPILRRLESGGFLTSYAVEHNGRLRKYYRMTEAGRRRLCEFTGEWRELMKIYEFVTGEVEKGE